MAHGHGPSWGDESIGRIVFTVLDENIFTHCDPETFIVPDVLNENIFTCDDPKTFIGPDSATNGETEMMYDETRTDSTKHSTLKDKYNLINKILGPNSDKIFKKQILDYHIILLRTGYVPDSMLSKYELSMFIGAESYINEIERSNNSTPDHSLEPSIAPIEFSEFYRPVL
jgi:hypothetical protein